jgi:hypothetical protein
VFTVQAIEASPSRKPGQAAFAPLGPLAQIRRKNMLVHIVIVLILIGLLLWLVNNYIPMDGKIKQILNIVVVIAVVLWLLEAFGILSGLGLGHV